MQIVSTQMTIAEYCQSIERKDLFINPTYQRSNKIWPLSARSFLIESILLGYPIPKISLYTRTDRISRRTVREIVDGQQRTAAIDDFFHATLRLSGNIDFEEIAGCTYNELGPDLQDRFLIYPLTIDEFVDTTEQEIREVFRRINSYVEPLNPEERRHATWQGKFKWYIYHLSRTADDKVTSIGVFTPRQLVRMQDTKLFSEVTHALEKGIQTTNKRLLDQLYKRNDRRFERAGRYTSWISNALEQLFSFRRLWKTPLVKSYSTYSFLLAAIHSKHNLEVLRPSLGQGAVKLASPSETESRLLGVVDHLEAKNQHGPYGRFVRATMGQTNVMKQRVARARLFLDALREDGGKAFA